jgi:Mrp family chromosome partitioning ATPase
MPTAVSIGAPAPKPPRQAAADAYNSLAPIATIPRLMSPAQGGVFRRPAATRSPFPGFARVCETAFKVGTNGAAAFWSAIFRVADSVVTGGIGEGRRTCLMLGARGGVGTSTTALALALSEAHAGSRVLLVDASGVDGDLATVFHDPSLRLPDSDRLDAAALATITTRDSGSGLEFLAIPRIVSGARRRIRPSAAAAALLSLAERYDLVVVDGGVVGVEPLARLLSDSVDRLIVIDGIGRSTAEIEAVARSTGLTGGRAGSVVLSDSGA